MKTLISFLAILALTAGAIKVDAYQLDGGDLFAALAVAALCAFALNDRRVVRPLSVAPVTRFPAAGRVRDYRGAQSVDLAA